MGIFKTIAEKFLALSSSNKAGLDASDKKIDGLWQEEAERRVTAYMRGEIKALKIEEVLSKYK